MALGSTMAMASATTAATLKVSVENLSPTKGSILSAVWVAFHDGSFDTFDLGAPASSGIEHVAEDGTPGLENTIPGFIEALKALGVDITNSPIPANETIASLFASSSAGMNGGIQSLVFPDILLSPPSPVIFPGQIATKMISLNGSVTSHRYFSYTTFVFPSNDAFIGNDDPIEIFDADGKFIGADFIVLGNQVLDAGTEVNDEDLSNVTFDLSKVGKGVDENGTIQLHPGLKSLGTGGVLDYEFPGGDRLFANADFKAPGYQVARITITQVPEPVPEPATTTGLFALGGLFILRRRVRQGR
ncbi:PEP-CTERM sorting domain-containing protein [Funiculus sociatus GB2-A5]|uniref:PEP-CTERM sorting domain-containing protein n=3 Tax=Cyanobacteriota TaxID=1117 RepID=A0ABV0JVC1_9CYAN